MTRPSPKLAMTVLSLVLALLAAAASADVSERMIILRDDGKHALIYQTLRSDQPFYTLRLSKDRKINQFLYVYPPHVIWEPPTDNHPTLLKFPEGNFATIALVDLSNQLTIGQDGVYVYTNWDGQKQSDGHYGFWNTQYYSQFSYVWVIPEQFKLVAYTCNRQGQWVLRSNTLAFFAQNVNDLVFTITYQPRARASYQPLEATLQGLPEITVAPQEKGTKVSLASSILFPSGSSALSQTGKSILIRISEILKQLGLVSIAVEGHTDNTPITGKLARVFPTNWELSAARSLAVVRYLAEQGLPEAALEARAYGEHRPKAPNATAQGRGENRRIELVIMDRAAP